MALGDFARLNERIGDVRDELRAAYRDAESRDRISAADNVDLRTCAVE
jgi:hypothetical protein